MGYPVELYVYAREEWREILKRTGGIGL